MIEHSDRHYLVADHTKFGQTSFVRISGFDEITAIVTNRPLDEAWHEKAEQVGCDIICGNATE